MIRDLYEISYRGEYSDYTKEAANRIKEYSAIIEKSKTVKKTPDEIGYFMKSSSVNPELHDNGVNINLEEITEEKQDSMPSIKEIATLQSSYYKLVKTKNVTKKAICDICIPFRDKYHLGDSDTLRIARNELRLYQIVELFEKK